MLSAEYWLYLLSFKSSRECCGNLSEISHKGAGLTDTVVLQHRHEKVVLVVHKSEYVLCRACKCVVCGYVQHYCPAVSQVAFYRHCDGGRCDCAMDNYFLHK